MFIYIALDEGIDEVLTVVPCIPVLHIIYLVLDDDGTDDEDDGKSELQHYQYFPRCDGCIYFFEAAFQHANVPRKSVLERFPVLTGQTLSRSSLEKASSFRSLLSLLRFCWCS